MTGGKHQAKKVVANVIFGIDICGGHKLLSLELATKILMFAFDQLAFPQEVNGAMLCDGRQPGARIVRDARLWPPLKCGHECVLRELLRETNVAEDPRQTSNDPRRLDPPNRVDYTMSI